MSDIILMGVLMLVPFIHHMLASLKLPLSSGCLWFRTSVLGQVFEWAG